MIATRSLAMSLSLAAVALGAAAHAMPEITLEGFETRATSVVAADDGGFFVVGVRRTAGAGGSTPMVARVGADESVKWVKAYERRGHFHPHVGAPLVGGGVVIAGEADPLGGGWHFWAAGVDGAGKEVWSLLIGPKGKQLVPDAKPNTYWARTVIGAPDGGAWVAGDVQVGASEQALVVRVDKRGKPVFTTHFGDAVRHERVIGLVPDGDGVRALVRENVETNRINPDAVYLVAIDAKGAVGARLDLSPNVETFGAPLAVRPLADGRWVVFGRGSWIAIFGADGKRHWLREYREMDLADFTGAEVGDDGFVAVGELDGNVRLVGFDRHGVRRFEKSRRREDGSSMEVGGLTRLKDGRFVFATTVRTRAGDVALPQFVDTTPTPLAPSFDLPHCPEGSDLFEREDSLFNRTALVCAGAGGEVGDRVVLAPSPTIAHALVRPGDRDVRLQMRRSRPVIERSLAIPGRDFFRFGAIEADLSPANADTVYPNFVFHGGNGVWVELYPDGADLLAVQLRGGFAQGPIRRHHPNGQLAETGAFVDGLPHGEWVRSDASGQELGRFTLERGTGTVTEWNERGQVTRTAELRNGRLHGWDLMFVNGRPSWATCHRDGAQAFKKPVEPDALEVLKASSPCP